MAKRKSLFGDDNSERAKVMKLCEDQESLKSSEDEQEVKKDLVWTEVQLQKLIAQIESAIPDNDTYHIKRRLKEINWEKVKFEPFSATDCSDKALEIVEKQRQYRVLSEVLQDAKKWVKNPWIDFKNKNSKHPDYPTQPPSAYKLFYKEKYKKYAEKYPEFGMIEINKEIAKKYHALPDNKKEKYIQSAAQLKEEFRDKLKEFYALHPEQCQPTEQKAKSSKVQSHPEKPARPLSSYMLYYKDKYKKFTKENPEIKNLVEASKFIGKKFNQLSEEKKAKYTLKAARLKNEYDIKLEEFYNKYPEERKLVNSKKKNKTEGPVRPLPPFKLFYESKVEKHKDDPMFNKSELLAKCKVQWKNMSEKKKSVWIKWTFDRDREYLAELKKYIADHPEFPANNVKPTILSKEEMKILNRISGKPLKPPQTAYSLFCSMNMKNDSFRNHKYTLADIADRWKRMSENDKKEYEEECKKLKEKYNVDYAVYLDSLPDDRRLEELQGNNKITSKKTVNHKEEKSQSTISNWVQKQPQKVKSFENEPTMPPATSYEYYVQQYGKNHPNLPEETVVKKAKRGWSKLSDSEKEEYEEKLKHKKNKYIADYKEFLTKLSKKQLKEYAAHKKGLKNDEGINKTSSSSDEDEDEKKSCSSSDESSSSSE